MYRVYLDNGVKVEIDAFSYSIDDREHDVIFLDKDHGQVARFSLDRIAGFCKVKHPEKDKVWTKDDFRLILRRYCGSVHCEDCELHNNLCRHGLDFVAEKLVEPFNFTKT